MRYGSITLKSAVGTCDCCGGELLNISGAKLAVSGRGPDTRVRIIHADCDRQFRSLHPKGWVIMKASELFDQLQ